MALVAGSVSVDSSLVRTGTGLALALYDAEVGEFTGLAIDTAAKKTLLDGLAGRSTRLAGALIAYLTANAEVTVYVSSLDAGLQTSTTPGSPTGPHVLPSPLALSEKATLG